MENLISREEAIIQLSHNKQRGDEEWELAVESDMEIIKTLSPAQSEPAIPLSWIETHIEWLKGLDNAFSILTALQIEVMVKKWRGEQDESEKL